MVLEYSLKFGPVGKAMDRMVVRSQFEKVVSSTLAGLKRYAEKQPALT